jgi:hypothetical protein
MTKAFSLIHKISPFYHISLELQNIKETEFIMHLKSSSLFQVVLYLRALPINLDFFLLLPFVCKIEMELTQTGLIIIPI